MADFDDRWMRYDIKIILLTLVLSMFPAMTIAYLPQLINTEFSGFMLFPIIFFGVFNVMWAICIIDIYKYFGYHEASWLIGIEKKIFERKFIEYLAKDYDMQNVFHYDKPLFTLFKAHYKITDLRNNTSINLKYIFGGLGYYRINLRLGPINKSNKELAKDVKSRINKFCILITDKKEQKKLVEEEKIFTKKELKDRERLMKRKDKKYKNKLKGQVNFIIIAGSIFLIIGLVAILVSLLSSDDSYDFYSMFYLGYFNALVGGLIVALGLISKLVIRATEKLEQQQPK
jgi:hypothetical protein